MLIQSVLFASVTSLAGGSPVGSAAGLAPMWAAYLAVQAPWRALQLAPPCGRSRGKLTSPCISASSGPQLGVALPAWDAYDSPELQLPRMGGNLGGFVNLDVMDVPHLSSGPAVSWLTPDSPREDLLRLRVVAPGWGVRYTWDETNVSVGVVACTRFVMFGEDWPVVDVLTSEARLQFVLP